MPEPVRILLVEDNTGDVYLFRRAFESAGLNVDLTVVGDGAEALAAVRGEGKYENCEPPDLMVLDLNIPKNDGVEVLDAIRRADRFADVPVILTSSSATPPPHSGAELRRASRYVMKPPDLKEFLRIGTIVKEVLLEKPAGRT